MNRFKPTPIGKFYFQILIRFFGFLGLHLIQAYSKLGLNLHKPDLRAEMAKDMKLICKHLIV